jgi:small conductance mechanosensitive channel
MAFQVDDEALQETCGDQPSFWCERILDWTGSETLARFVNWFVDIPLTILIIVVVAVVVNRLVRRAIRHFVDRIGSETDTKDHEPGLLRRAPALIAPGPPSLRAAARAKAIGGVLRSIASILIYTIAILLILAELGINLAPLIAGAGIAGVALGFGAQSLVKDFISGIFMMIEDQYGVGDVIDVGDATGTVERISLRTTRLRDVNGTVWYFPNGEILRVANKSQGWARAVLDIAVAYGTDIELAQSVIKRVADEFAAEDEWAGKVIEPPEVWGIENLAADGIVIRLVEKTEPAAAGDVQRELRRRIIEAFEAEGIKPPMPALWRGTSGSG